MRSEILPQTQEFKMSVPHVCEMCECHFEANQLDVDHKPPVTFAKLSNEFIENYQGMIPNEFTNSSGVVQGAARGAQTKAFLQRDRPFAEAWGAHHKSKCQLRLLCKTCHHKSGKKNK
jgi:hypothetical protein